MPPREVPTADDGRVRILPAASPSGADEVAEAEARAEAARARAIRLRQLAEGGDPAGGSAAQEPAALGDAAASDGTESEAAPKRRRWRRWLRRPGRPSRKAMAVAGAIVLICASLTGSGLLVQHHREVVAQRQQAAEFSAAARNAIVTMMSIDPSKVRDQMQRFADGATGIFKIGFLMGAEDMVKAVEQSKISTKVTVQAVAVQSMSKDSALVLVAARTEMTKPGEPKPSSRLLRTVVGIQRDAGQLKVSRVEFVP